MSLVQVFHREVFLDLFYLLYYIFDSKTNAHFYADDTALYTTGSSLILMTAKLQPADTLKKYFSKCKCVLNYDKTNHMLLVRSLKTIIWSILKPFMVLKCKNLIGVKTSDSESIPHWLMWNTYQENWRLSWILLKKYIFFPFSEVVRSFHNLKFIWTWLWRWCLYSCLAHPVAIVFRCFPLLETPSHMPLALPMIPHDKFATYKFLCDGDIITVLYMKKPDGPA